MTVFHENKNFIDWKSHLVHGLFFRYFSINSSQSSLTAIWFQLVWSNRTISWISESIIFSIKTNFVHMIVMLQLEVDQKLSVALKKRSEDVKEWKRHNNDLIALPNMFLHAFVKWINLNKPFFWKWRNHNSFFDGPIWALQEGYDTLNAKEIGISNGVITNI